MNEDDQLTTEALQLATRRTLPPGIVLDASTAAAREAFLSLGSALTSAGGAVDEQALAARLQRECLSEYPADNCVAARFGQRTWSRPLVHGVLAVAALALVACFVGWPWPTKTELGPSRPVQVPAGAQQDALPPAFAANSSDSYSATETRDGWSDPLDEQIAYVAATIGELSSPSRGVDESLGDAGNRLQALSQEMFSESL